MTQMTHWKKAMNPDYIGSYAFQPGEEKVGTIASVDYEEITGDEGRKEQKQVCHFVEKDLKPLILNVTICKCIEKLYGSPYIEDWIGKSIIMCVQKVKAFGEIVDAVRVRPVKPYVCKECGKSIIGYGSMSHNEVYDYTRKEYGKALCSACATKEKAKRKAEEQE